MGILAINTNTTGLVGDTVQPRRCTMLTTADLSTIITPGYINQNSLSSPIFPTDIFQIIYNYDEVTKIGDNGTFKVVMNDGLITLIPNFQGLYKEIPITSDEFKGMFVTPNLLVGAPGSDLLLIPTQAIIILYAADEVAYNNGGVVRINYGDELAATATIDIAAAAFTGPNDVVINMPCLYPSASNYKQTADDAIGAGLYLSNSTGAFTDGTGDLAMYLWYNVIRTNNVI